MCQSSQSGKVSGLMHLKNPTGHSASSEAMCHGVKLLSQEEAKLQRAVLCPEGGDATVWKERRSGAPKPPVEVAGSDSHCDS